jgi:hypothetical protein
MHKSKAQIKSIIRDIVQNSRISFSSHCRKRMPERNVITDDFLKVLNWGEISEQTWDEEHQCYKCRVDGQDVDGDDLSIIVAVDEQNFRIRCITVI